MQRSLLIVNETAIIAIAKNIKMQTSTFVNGHLNTPLTYQIAHHRRKIKKFLKSKKKSFERIALKA